MPASDAEDITQTVLYDALVAPRLPAEPTDLRRFLCVLARNKIADFYRRARRFDRSVDPADVSTGVLQRIVHDDALAITPDPASDPGARVLGLLQGRWQLAESSALETAAGKRIDHRFVDLRVHGHAIDVLAPLHVTTLTIVRSTEMAPGVYELETHDEAGHEERAELAVRDGHARATLRSGRLRGTAELTKR